MKIAILVPHMFMHKDLVYKTIFAPGILAIDLVNGLKEKNCEITFISPNFRIEGVKNINGDLKYFNEELKLRDYGIFELLQKHPLLFASLSRQIQSELIAKTFELANSGKFDLIHVYMNEEELAMVFSRFCNIPIVFTHHEPFNFLTKYRTIFPKYKDLNWISISKAQRKSLPPDTNWIANIYHGINEKKIIPNFNSDQNYFAYFGRIIEPKGVHLAIAAAKKAGVKLKIAGKHYSGFGKDDYWKKIIEPEIDNDLIEFIGFISDQKLKNEFLGNAKALLVPSIWEEPFGIVLIEAMACGTPIIGLNSGAIGEIIVDGENGFLVEKLDTEFANVKIGKYENKEEEIISDFVKKIKLIEKIDRKKVRKLFEEKFTLERMIENHLNIYKKQFSKHSKLNNSA